MVYYLLVFLCFSLVIKIIKIFCLNTSNEISQMLDIVRNEIFKNSNLKQFTGKKKKKKLKLKVSL